MLKTAMLVSALALSTSALAQERTQPVDARKNSATSAAQSSTPTTTAPAQDTAVPQSTADQAVPAETATTSDATTGSTTTDVAASAAASPAAPAAVTGATQIATVVNTEFPTYDKNADTNLDKTEFGAWMVALKSASDPATKATDPATVKWVDGAFASADADKSKAVSKAELTTYLSQGAE